MRKHYAGSTYVFDNIEYLLALVAPGTFQLISMTDGNRWDDPYRIMGEPNRSWISEMEFADMLQDYRILWVQNRNAELNHPWNDH